ncbi:MAG: succinic semialdehyde dehydrogenase [Candidatus Binatia bacterium]
MALAAETLESGERRTITVVNPATLEKVADVAVTTAVELAEAERRAREAQAAWAEKSFAERAEALIRYRDRLLDGAERLADVLTSETGKPRGDAYAVELIYICDAISYWAKNAESFLADERVSPHLLKNKVGYSTYVPVGVVGIIGPWNFPLVLTIGDALPALMAGNAVIIKPSEITPRTALHGAEAWRESGLDPGLLQVVPGFGDTGAKLIDHVDMILFTGSIATGRKVAVKAAEQLKPCSLELGGKDPMIVLRDANLERAANCAVWGGLVNSGQVCLSVERVYVEEPVYDRFVGLVEEKIKRVKQGPSAEAVDIGSMTFPAQLEKVERHVEDAVAKGAKVLAGGRRNSRYPGLYYEPTLLVDVNHDMDVMRDETFGPVIPIMKVRDEEEAIRLANDSRYGLGASVFTADKEKGRAIARRIEAGGICVNDAIVHFAVTDLPMGGVKESGIGRRHGPEGIRKFCYQKSVVIDRFGLKSELNWFPNTAAKLSGLKRLMRLLYRSGWRKKLSS